MNYFLGILFLSLSVLGLCVAFITHYRRFNRDRAVIFTELMESRHRLNTLNNDICAYIHNTLNEKRATRALTEEESALWEKTREIMRQYKIEAKKYEAMFVRS